MITVAELGNLEVSSPAGLRVLFARAESQSGKWAAVSNLRQALHDQIGNRFSFLRRD